MIKIVKNSTLSDEVTDDEVDSRMLSEFSYAMWAIGKVAQEHYTDVEQVQRVLYNNGYDLLYKCDDEGYEFKLRTDGIHKTINDMDFYKESVFECIRDIFKAAL